MSSCTTIEITQHAFIRAIERDIDLAEAVNIVKTGEIIIAYPDDKPYPSRLILGFTTTNQPLHVLVGEGPDGICAIITVYRPETDIWAEDFKTRKAN